MSPATVSKQTAIRLWPGAAVYLVVLCLAHGPSFVLCNDSDGENMQKYANESLAVVEADSNAPIWSQFLEDYVLSQSSSQRTSKDLPYMGGGDMGMSMSINGPLNYHSSAYKRPGNNIYITRRIGEAVELEPHLRKPVESQSPIVNPQFRPMTNQMLHQQQQQHLQQQQQQQQQQQRQQPGFLQQLFGIGGSSGGGNPNPNPPPPPQQQQHLRPVPLQQQQHQQQHLQGSGQPTTFRAVSENDLYLLGAIEKLVYRVDYLESRVRRSEQLIYYLMAGNKEGQKEVKDPCPTNFTRISDNCYYINSQQQVNWKTANSACKALNSHLAEFEKVSENEEIMAYLLNQPPHRGRDYWLGGLNPGLLWIWSNSAKPVNPNTNLTSIAMAQKSENATASNLVDSSEETSEDGSDVLNNTVQIEGKGRCLRLSYNAGKHSYVYYGQECTSRHYYICEHEDRTLDNKIKKISRELKLFE
ncbi:nuclear transcription factor Y subunit beta [Drosophila miranda]|uniref:nuclear transcription factor Y subunit beta n=1 Tax=Drosophila miranda TaxID=7229 RepID=UPI0007E878AD|nr:nuclear transcription factor Y subunit beta [Drosophila miranda]